MAPSGPKSGLNRLKISYWPRKSAWRAYFELDGVEQCWNTTCAFSQTIVGLFHVKMVKKLVLWLKKWPRTDQSRSKYDKMVQIGLNTITFIGTGWNKVGTKLEQHWGNSGWPVWPICQTQNAPNMTQSGPKSGPNRLKIAYWPCKSAWRA